MPTTLAQAKVSRIPVVVGACADSDKFLAYLNEAQERLLSRGLWKGTYAYIRLCVDDACITWPRQVENVEAIRLRDYYGVVRNEWFQFLTFEPRSYLTTCCNGSDWWHCGGESNLYNRGTFPTFADIKGTNKKLKVYLQYPEDVGKRIFLQGLDENGNPVRTVVEGERVDGEYVTLASPSATTTNFFSVLTAVQKDVTAGNVRLYTIDPSDNERAIANYEPDEEIPNYRRTYLKPLPRAKRCCDYRTIEAMVKLAFIPARRNTDFLLIGNLTALKFECQAIKKEEDDLTVEAEMYHQKAIRELNNELRTYNGRDNVSAYVSINGTAPMVSTQL